MTSSVPFQSAVQWFLLGGLRRNHQVLGFARDYNEKGSGVETSGKGRHELVRCVSWNGFSSEVSTRNGNSLVTSSGNYELPASATSDSDDSSCSGVIGSDSKRLPHMGTLSQKELEDYLKEKEYQDLLQGSNRETDFVDNGQGNDDPDDEDNPTPEEAVSDADWLRETGFEFLIKAFDDAEGEDDAPLKEVISTLTLAQAEAVLKRVDHVRAATIQKRKIGKRLPDVRDVFPSIKEDEYKGDGPLSAPLIPGNSLSKSTQSLIEDDFDPLDVHSSYSSSKLSSDGQKNYDLANVEKKNRIEQHRQSSVDEVRTVFKAQNFESKNKKNWMDKNPFLRGNHKQGYKLGHTPEGPISATGVQVLSYNIRSSMKHLRPNSAIRRKSIMNLFYSTEEIPDEDYLSDKNDDDFGFKVLDGVDIQENSLPEVEIIDNPLGVTIPSDLGVEDQKKMHTLALIELTTLFDEHGLTYSRRKAAKRKLKDGGIFGVPLTTLVEEDRGKFPKCQTPVIFQRLLEEMEKRTLHEEGILRKTASMQAAECLKELVDSSYRTSPQIVEEALAQASPHDLSFLTKSFIRELPEPLLTNAYLDAFLQVTALPSILEQLKALNLLVMLLSEVHRETLKRLLEFLERVIEKEEYNRMNAQNISVIMAPNLFPPPRNSRTNHGHQEMSKKDIEQEVALATQSATIAKMLLKYRDVLWMVPPPLLKQIREQNEESRLRLNKEHKGLKLLHRKPKDEVKPRSNSDTNVHERNGHNSSPTTGQVTTENNNKKSVLVHLECDRRKVFSVGIEASTTVSFVLEKALEAAGGCGREKVNGRSRASSLENYFYTTIPTLTNDLVPSLSLTNGHVLYEVGGNIGQRKLDPSSRICALLRNNPDAEWVVKCGI